MKEAGFESSSCKTPQFAVEFLFASADQTVQQRMETRRMVVMDRVAEFVEDDEVAQRLGQRHQEETQRDVVLSRTTPPLCARGTDREFFITQARCGRKPGDTLRLEVRFVKRRGPMAVAEGVAWVGDQKAAEAEIKCMVIMD